MIFAVPVAERPLTRYAVTEPATETPQRSGTPSASKPVRRSVVSVAPARKLADSRYCVYDNWPLPAG